MVYGFGQGEWVDEMHIVIGRGHEKFALIHASEQVFFEYFTHP